MLPRKTIPHWSKMARAGWRLALLVTSLAILRVSSKAQGPVQTITGTVLLSNGSESPAGTSVTVKGADAGTVTDDKGHFSLTLRLPSTLVISRVGYISTELNLKSAGSISVTLQASGNNLNEVLVISYGSAKKKDITGAVVKVNASETRNIAAAELGQKLQGKVAGLQINQTSGRPGQGIDFRVRGAASLSSGFQPLIVVDGQPLTGASSRNGDVNLINPDEIETFTVLKDAAATALYGSRAANGVILITTRQARGGRTQLSVDAYTGWQSVPKRGRPDLMSAREFAGFMKGYYEDKARYENYTGSIPADYASPEKYNDGTNWYNALLRTAPINDISLNISSGNEKLLSSSTLSYFDQQGVLLNTGMKRYAFRSNNEYRLSSRVKFGINIAPTYQLDHNTRNSTDGNRQIIGNATAASPLFPVFQADGSYTGRVSSAGMLGFNNPVQQMVLADGNQRSLRLLSNFYGEAELIKNLKLKSTFNADLGASEYNQFLGTMYGIGLNAAPLPRPASSSSSIHGSYDYWSWLNENTLAYSYTADQHNIDLFAGYSAQKWVRNYRNISGSNFAGDAIPWIAGAATTSGTNNNEAWSLASAFGRVGYNYAGRYILSATIRQDGSSRFGANKKYGVFPSASAAWLVSSEPFFPKNSVVTFLKLRGSYGKTGNYNIGNYSQISNITTTNYVFGGSLTPGLSVTSLGNPELTWEVSNQADASIELSLLNDRISFSYDYYKKIAEGMLFTISLPSASGYTGVTANVGRFKIWGHELQLSTKNLTGPLEWNTDFNIAFNDNKVLSMPPNTKFIGGGPRYSGWNRTAEGRRIGEFYGYVFDGIYMTQAEFDSQPKEATSMVGTTRMKDVNGDGKIDENDRTYIGNPNPKFIFGMSNSFRYKNIDLSVVIAGQYGNKILNASLQDLHNNDGVFNMSRDMINRWRSESQPGDGKTPRTRSGTTELYRLANSTWVMDGSYLTVKNIALGYTFKPVLFNAMRTARIYASVQQAFVFTKYKGQNPEASIGRDDAINTYGQDLSTFPVPRTFMIGANISF